MITTFNHSEFLNENKQGINSLFNILKTVNSTFGYVGSYLFVPVGQIAGFILYKKLYNQNKRLKQSIQTLIDSISDRSLEELRSIHLDVEKLNREFLTLLSQSNSKQETATFYRTMFKKIYSIIQDDEAMLMDLERKLLSAAYPEKQRILSAESMQELRSAYQSVMMTDWDDDSLDVYEEYYSLEK